MAEQTPTHDDTPGAQVEHGHAPSPRAPSGSAASVSQPADDRLQVAEAPPERVGLLLAEVRTKQGLRLEDVAGRLGGTLDATGLMALESGAVEVSPEVLEELGRIYGVKPDDLVPPRDQLVVDLNEGYLRAGPDISLLNDGVGRRDVLNSYLEMVWELRSLDRGSVVALRGADLRALSAHFGAEPAELEAELRTLMATQRRGGRAKVLVGLAVAVAAVTGGVLVWQSQGDSEPQGEPVADVEQVPEDLSGLPVNPNVEIGEAETLERGEDPGALPPAPSSEIGDAATLERAEDPGALPPAPSAEIGDAVVQERNPDGTPGPQQTR